MNGKIKTYTLFFFMLIVVSQSVMAQRDVRTDIRRGNRAYHQERFSDAIERYESAIDGNINSKEAIFNLGNALYRQGEWGRAVDQYRHFLSLEQEDPIAMSNAWHNIGNALLKQYRVQDAMEAYKNALRLNPRDDETRYNLAVAQRMVRDQEEEDQADGEDNEEQDPQEQEQEQDQPQRNQRVEESDGPEQMSRSAASEILQAIEQSERETLERVQRMRDAERDNRRLERNW